MTQYSAILEALAFPPGNVLVLAVFALFLRGFTRRVVLVLALVALYLQSAPVSVNAFVAPLKRYPPLDLDHLPSADAIVVLGGGVYRNTVSGATLERLQYAAALERASGLPMVLSGGSVTGEAWAEAPMMADVLRTTFGLSNEIVVEAQSRNTAENAVDTKAMLDARGWHRVLLVTHALHLSRAVVMFEKNGVEVIPAPVRLDTASNDGHFQILHWLPSAQKMYELREACHEYVGAWWYRVRY